MKSGYWTYENIYNDIPHIFINTSNVNDIFFRALSLTLIILLD